VFRVPESEVRRIAEGLPISREVRAIVYASCQFVRPEERPREAGRVLDAVLLL
jgi:hypothetical protein